MSRMDVDEIRARGGGGPNVGVILTVNHPRLISDDRDKNNYEEEEDYYKCKGGVGGGGGSTYSYLRWPIKRRRTLEATKIGKG